MYLGKLCPDHDVAIDKSVGDAFSIYVDLGIPYFNKLRIRGGKYNVKAGESVVIKTTEAYTFDVPAASDIRSSLNSNDIICPAEDTPTADFIAQHPVGVFSIFVSFPICFLFFYEIYKCFINNKDCCDKIKNKKINKMKEKFELATKNVLFEEDDEDNINLNINDENRDTNNTNKEMNLISEKIFKDVNIEESDILSQSSKNSVIPIAQTPILKNDLDNKKNNLLFDESSEG